MNLRLNFSKGVLFTGYTCNSLAIIQLKSSLIHERGCFRRGDSGYSHATIKAHVNVSRGLVVRDCNKETVTNVHVNGKVDVFPHVRTLRGFPKEQLSGKVVLVRFDSSIVFPKDTSTYNRSDKTSVLFTIKFLYSHGAKIMLITDWDFKRNSSFHSLEKVAEYMSSVLELKVVPAARISCQVQTQMAHLERGDILLLDNLSYIKEERANDLDFSRSLSSGVDIFVNESFSLAHRVLASTVGVTSFCSSSVAGFHFEKHLKQLQKITECSKRPYLAIIGGGSLVKKEKALRFLLSQCDGLIFVGTMSFLIMHTLGLPVPSNLVEQRALKVAEEIVCYAVNRDVPIIFPKDFWCTNDLLPEQRAVFPANEISNGWSPVDIRPSSFIEIASHLSRCEKILWIGPMKFNRSDQSWFGATKLALLLEKLSQKSCDVTVVGNVASESFPKALKFATACEMIETASVVWEFLKTRSLPGISGLDRAYPYDIDWKAVYYEPSLPLTVDLGSGNGMFLIEMAHQRRDANFLGIEMNEKLVSCCMSSALQLNLENIYFIATNATSTFQTIISSYPGPLTLVSIQCPNPDFNQPDHRWRMVQKSLIEDIAELLVVGGKVFLQSDVKAVAARMRDQFLEESKGKLTLVLADRDDGTTTDSNGWLNESPFGVRSDWERHVLARGNPMYRVMLSKVP